MTSYARRRKVSHMDAASSTKTERPAYLRCSYCGRRKAYQTSRTHFGDGCRSNPKGPWHHYNVPEFSSEQGEQHR